MRGAPPASPLPTAHISELKPKPNGLCSGVPTTNRTIYPTPYADADAMPILIPIPMPIPIPIPIPFPLQPLTPS